MADVSKIHEGMAVHDVSGQWLGNIVKRGVGRSLIAYGTFTRQLLVLDDAWVDRVDENDIRLKVTRHVLVNEYTRRPDEKPYQTQEEASQLDAGGHLRDPATLEQLGEQDDTRSVMMDGGASARVQTRPEDDWAAQMPDHPSPERH